MSSPSATQCQYSTWFYLHTTTGEIQPFVCKSWHCPEHRQRLAWAWACKVARAHPERMVTLTKVPRDRTRARLAFSHLVQQLRRELGRFEYVRFLELGSKTGMYHYHLGEKGAFVPKHLLSARAEANGLGKITDIRACHGEGPGWYMAKYIAKGLESIPKGWRKVAASRGFFDAEPPRTPEMGWTLVKGLFALPPATVGPSLAWPEPVRVGQADPLAFQVEMGLTGSGGP